MCISNHRKIWYAVPVSYTHLDILEYDSPDWFDYIFISSGSISLFTDTKLCRRILKKLKEMLTPEGRLVFAIETMADRCPDDDGYKITEMCIRDRIKTQLAVGY